MHYTKAVNSRIVQKSGWICCLIPDSRELLLCFYTLSLLHLDFSCWTSSEIFNEAPTFIPVMLAICSFDSESNLWPSIPYKTNKNLHSSILPPHALIILKKKKKEIIFFFTFVPVPKKCKHVSPFPVPWPKKCWQ